jgi:hypothetical protein
VIKMTRFVFDQQKEFENHEKFVRIINIPEVKEHICSKGIYDYLTLWMLFEISEKNREPGRPYFNMSSEEAFLRTLEIYENVIELEKEKVIK